MTLFHNSFEGGTNGAQITVANSGGASGDAFSYICYNNASYPNGNANLVYSTAAAKAGSMGARLTLGTATTYLAWSKPTGAGSRIVARRPWRQASSPGSAATILALRNASATIATAIIRTTGAIRICDNTGVSTTGSNYQLSNNTDYWIELAVTNGTTTSNGRVELKVYASDGTTELWSYDSGTTLNCGTTTPQDARFATHLSTNGWATDDLDEIQFNNNLPSGWIGPFVASNTPPVVDVTADDVNVYPGETVTFTGTATDSDGTIASTSWSATGGVALTTVDAYHRTHTAAPRITDLAVTVTFSATDDDGASSSDTVNITLKASLPPTLDVDQPAPNVVDLRASTAGDGSSLTFPTPTETTSTGTTPVSLAAGLWLFDDTDASTWTVSCAQGDTQSDSASIDVTARGSLGVSHGNAPLMPTGSIPGTAWG